jgi:hypothetical protein
VSDVLCLHYVKLCGRWIDVKLIIRLVTTLVVIMRPNWWWLYMAKKFGLEHCLYVVLSPCHTEKMELTLRGYCHSGLSSLQNEFDVSYSWFLNHESQCYYFVSVVAAIGCRGIVTNTGLFVYSKLSTVQHVLSAEKVLNTESDSLSLRFCMHIFGPSS